MKRSNSLREIIARGETLIVSLIVGAIAQQSLSFLVARMI